MKKTFLPPYSPSTIKRYVAGFILFLTLFMGNGLQSLFAQVTVTGAVAGDGSYSTLGAAFTAINGGVQTGATINISLSGNTTETASAILNTGAWTAVNITATVPVVISGTIAGAVIKLNGADNVTIDGRIGGTGRNITVQNNSTAATTAAIWLASVAAGNGCTGNIIRNCEIACGATQNTSTTNTWGIIMNGTTISNTVNGTDNDNNTFQENRIIRCRHGIVTRGTTTNLNENIQVIDNIIGPDSFGADQIGIVGIFMQADNNSTVSGNTVQFVGGPFASTTGGADRVGIAIGANTWSVTSTTTITSTNYTVTRNLIHDIIEERTFSAVGLILGTTNGGLATNNFVCSNMIYNVKSNGISGDATCGIGISGGHTDQVVYNSILLSGDVDPNPSATATAIFGSGIRTSNTATTHNNLTLKNNIVYMDLSSSSSAGVRFYCVTGTAAAYTWGTGGSNNNNFYYNTANPQCLTGGLATVTGATATTQFTLLSDWQTAYTNPGPQDGASIQANPGFVSSTDLHISTGSTAVNNLGTTSGVTCTFDYDNETRSVTTPDIGADEYTPVSCSVATGGTISPNTQSKCVGQTATMTTTGSTVGVGTTYQWMVSSVSGSGYVPVTGGNGANTTSYTTDPLLVGTYYYVLEVTCSNCGPCSSFSNELTVTVNPYPTASASSNSPVCSDATLDLTSSTDIGTTFLWSGPNSFSSTIQNPSISNITTAGAGTYTVSVTASGCTSTASTSVSVSPAITASASATPSEHCVTGTSQLNAVGGGGTINYLVASTTYALQPTAGFTTGISGDDVISASLPLPFTFNFYGQDKTSFFINTNGQIGFNYAGSSAAQQRTAQTIPNATVPNDNISLCWSDLNPTAGQITYGTIGTTPDQIFVIDFNNVPFFSATGSVSGQIQLYETSNVIQIHVTSVNHGTATFTQTLGVENSTGTLGTAAPGRNNVLWNISTPEAWIFSPPSALTYSWSESPALPTTLSATNIANPMANSVTETKTYTVTVTDPNSGCSNTANTTVTINQNVNAGTISGTSPLCVGATDTYTTDGTSGGTWNSSDDLIATVDPGTGLVTAIASGSATITYSILTGCGSPVSAVKVVEVISNTSNSTSITDCGFHTWSVNNVTYTETGIYSYVTGCHTEFLDLTIIPNTSNTTTISACDSYTWPVNGVTYTGTDTYFYTFSCHTEILDLTITPSTSNTTTISACDSYTWPVNGVTYTGSDIYTFISGCHTEILNLTVTPSSSNSNTITQCFSYTWPVNGVTYTESGTYTDINGCHTETLNLTITEGFVQNNTVTACFGYYWNANDQFYDESGTYVYIDDCYMEILNLTISDCPLNFSFEFLDPCVCNNDATTAANDGTFDEFASVSFDTQFEFEPADFEVTVLSSTGTTGLPNGTVLDFNGEIQLWETPIFSHVDEVGYSIVFEVRASVENNLGLDGGELIATVIGSNKCAYPNPAVSGLASSYCSSDSGGVPDNDITVILTGSPTGPEGVFTLSGTDLTGGPTMFTFTPPATLGSSTLTGTYFGAEDEEGGISPDGGTTPAFPGCIQPFSATTNIVDCPPGCNASPNMQWDN